MVPHGPDLHRLARRLARKAGKAMPNASASWNGYGVAAPIGRARRHADLGRFWLCFLGVGWRAIAPTRQMLLGITTSGG